ncbi:molybdate transport system substrate-binding protein [Pelomonas saccharophila]|uniref:Molybdate transport system substrate-binding protein n=1 Tax=Roseateles saccharophilus TaxID=304 RepID=A0ABU1YGJ4_ROSSA|nr:molybdate ABC transporter substrate-binding protein [Roseateles saccharophilus]MDR7267974.1 molybdate transport system substrate-binding protein [Roseateles saccharophilus]
MKRVLIALCTALPLLASAQQLTVSAAASLADAFKEIGPRFEASKPGASLRFNFAASGVLLQQIAQGAPVDVLVSADHDTMNRGADQKLIATGTRRDFASNTLVLVAPPDSPVKRVDDLSLPTVKRIAVGKVASVPVGRYIQQALGTAQLWSALSPKLVFADNVRQVLDYVARGEVQAGFVYRTDAEIAKDKVRVVATVGGHTPITYPAAVVADSRQAALARDFVVFLGSAEAQAILAKYGFGKP